MDTRELTGLTAPPYTRDIGGMIYFNVSAATGRDAQHLPNALKPTSGYLTDVSQVGYERGADVVEPLDQLLAQVGTWADPRSGGLWFDQRGLADFFGWSATKQVQRNLALVSSGCYANSNFNYIRTIGDGQNRVWVTCVGSAAPHARAVAERRAQTKF